MIYWWPLPVRAPLFQGWKDRHRQILGPGPQRRLKVLGGRCCDGKWYFFLRSICGENTYSFAILGEKNDNRKFQTQLVALPSAIDWNNSRIRDDLKPSTCLCSDSQRKALAEVYPRSRTPKHAKEKYMQNCKCDECISSSLVALGQRSSRSPVIGVRCDKIMTDKTCLNDSSK